MTPTAGTLLAVAAVVGIGDWVAVARGGGRAERFLKPATLVALIGVAVTLDPALEAQRRLFVLALLCSLVGDVALLRPDEGFVGALVAFMAAHVAYVIGFTAVGPDPAALGVAVVLVGAFGVFLAVPILSAVDDARLRAGVAGYMLTLAAMVATATGTQHPLAATGAALFLASDTVLGWDRFVGDLPWAQPVIMIAYHLGQGLIVLSLVG